jgi:HNH/Endo VII superfamily nuclease toxin with a HHH motif
MGRTFEEQLRAAEDAKTNWFQRSTETVERERAKLEEAGRQMWNAATRQNVPAFGRSTIELRNLGAGAARSQPVAVSRGLSGTSISAKNSSRTGRGYTQKSPTVAERQTAGEQLNAVLRGGRDATTFGTGDEIAAGLATLRRWPAQPSSWASTFGSELVRIQKLEAYDKAKYPVGRNIGEGVGMAGSALLTSPAGIGVGVTGRAGGTTRVLTSGAKSAPQLAERALVSAAENVVGSDTLRVVRPPANATRFGVPRTSGSDWRTLRDHWDDLGYEGILSPENRIAIAKSRSPVVDDAWISIFPEDVGLIGEQIEMHHIGGTPLTLPWPKTRHLDAHMPGGFRTNKGGPGSAWPPYPRKPPVSGE